MSILANRLSAAWALAGGGVVLLIMLVTAINVGAFGLDKVARTLGANVAGLPGYEDFVRLAVSCAALMFLPYCQAQRGHVRVELFAGRIPKAVRRALERFWLAVLLLVIVFLAYWMVAGMLETRADNALSPVLGWIEWPFYVPGIVSLALWAFVPLSQIVEPAGD